MSMSSVIRYVKALDSTATNGSGKTGLVFGDFTAKYLTQGGTLTSLTTETITTLGTYQAPTSSAHIRIKELASAAPTQGIYEVHFHNTQMANTGKKLWLFLSATGAVLQPLEVDLIPYMDLDPQSADDIKDFADAGYDPSTNKVQGVVLVDTATNLTNAPTAGDLTSTMKASVNTEVDAAIETYHLDHLLANTYDPASKPGAADALLNELVESDAGVARYTANALEQAPSGGGGGPTADQIADEVETRTIAGVTTVGSVSGSVGSVTGNVGGNVTGSVGSVAGNVSGNVAGSVGSVATGGITAASFAANSVDAAALATSAVNEIQAGLATSAALTTVDSNVTSIKAKTDNLPSDPADASDIAAAFTTVNNGIADLPTNAELATALAAADDVTLAAIIANGLQALGSDPTGVPGATASYADKIDWQTALSRNKLTQTSSSAVLHDDSGSAVASAVVSDDGTTYQRQEWV